MADGWARLDRGAYGGKLKIENCKMKTANCVSVSPILQFALFNFHFSMRRGIIITLWAVCSAAMAHADVRLPAIFSDHMVLQAETNVAVWGRADPGEEVTVSFSGQTKVAHSGWPGRWMVRLDKLKSTSEPQTLTVKGKNTLTVNDVLIGEVWLGSGQSNMEMQIKGRLHGSVDHADEEIAAANFPQIRMFMHHHPFAIYELA